MDKQLKLKCFKLSEMSSDVYRSEYLRVPSRMHNGLTTVATRELAYQFAKINNIKVPNTWEELKTSGRDWCRGFMTRRHELSTRAPEATSIGRATGFNRETVRMFFHHTVSHTT